jgi:hypothetical protein
MFSIIAISFVTLIIASIWEKSKSDKVLNDVILSLSTGKEFDNIIIERPQQFRLKDITKNYEVELKDNNIFWGQIYRVKFDLDVIYRFYVDLGILGQHKVKVLNYHGN